MKPGSNRNCIHDVIAICRCKDRSNLFYDGDTRSFICGECGCKVLFKGGEVITVGDTKELERITQWVSTNAHYQRT